MKVRRDISSIPLRTAEATWDTIIELVTGTDSVDADQFQAAKNVLASLITDEIFDEHPLTMTGVSHRLVIYLLYRSDALEVGESVDELAWNPTAGNWQMFVPCPDEDFDWVRKSLEIRASRFVVIKPGDEIKTAESEDQVSKGEPITVNWGVFDK